MLLHSRESRYQDSKTQEVVKSLQEKNPGANLTKTFFSNNLEAFLLQQEIGGFAEPFISKFGEDNYLSNTPFDLIDFPAFLIHEAIKIQSHSLL